MKRTFLLEIDDEVLEKLAMDALHDFCEPGTRVWSFFLYRMCSLIRKGAPYYYFDANEEFKKTFNAVPIHPTVGG